jgi:PAS domain S-box-containing protein
MAGREQQDAPPPAQTRLDELEAENRALGERLAAQQAELDSLRAQYDMLDLMLDTVPVFIAYGDGDFNIRHVNRQLATWWGYPKEALVGRNLSEVMLPGGFDGTSPFMVRSINDRQIVTHERTVVARDGLEHVLRQIYSPDVDDQGQVRGIAGVVLDVTEERRADESQRIQARHAAVSEERSRIARDLHDAATQTIYSALLIAEALPQVYARNPEDGQRNLLKLRRLVRGALAEMRTLLFELRPRALESVDLCRLLESLRDTLMGHTHAEVTWDVPATCELPPPTKLALYRIAQETFNNIAKHARAGQVHVRLLCGDGAGSLVITDDGRGFDPQTVAGDRMGLSIMRERAEGIGATLAVAGGVGEGTQITVSWTAAAAETGGI